MRVTLGLVRVRVRVKVKVNVRPALPGAQKRAARARVGRVKSYKVYGTEKFRFSVCDVTQSTVYVP